MKSTILSIFTFALSSFAVIAEEAPKSEQSNSRFPKVDGSLIIGLFIDLDGDNKDKVYIRYARHSDSGVEITRRTKDGSIVWRFYVQPLRIAHSSYSHTVSAHVKDGTIYVTSKGSKIINESINLASGKQISRLISKPIKIANKSQQSNR